MWKCADAELQRQIRCFPYRVRTDFPLLQQVEQKAVARQRNLGLRSLLQLNCYEYFFCYKQVRLAGPRSTML